MQLKYLYFSTSFVFPCNKVSLECRVEKLYHRLRFIVQNVSGISE